MSVTQVPLQPVAKGTLPKLWLAIAALIALAFGIAYMGAGQFKAVTVEPIQAGSGPLIAEQDAVLIEYTGRLKNGTVFQSTEGQGPIPIAVGSTVPGFKQALVQMQKGGRYKIVIPGRLAYGNNPPPESGIGVNEDLTFDVHIVDVAPGAAAQISAAQQQQQAAQ
jgi:FKBP-type peptidyl-prolyl cis-trans isomerase FkpA